MIMRARTRAKLFALGLLLATWGCHPGSEAGGRDAALGADRIVPAGPVDTGQPEPRDQVGFDGKPDGLTMRTWRPTRAPAPMSRAIQGQPTQHIQTVDRLDAAGGNVPMHRNTLRPAEQSQQ